jgi:hypothetical protein
MLPFCSPKFNKNIFIFKDVMYHKKIGLIQNMM